MLPGPLNGTIVYFPTVVLHLGSLEGKCACLFFFHYAILGGGFKYFLFSSLFGEMIQFDYIIFFRWVETTN